MVIMVTADPLLPKLESPPTRAEPPPIGREQRSILSPLPPAVSLSFTLPSGSWRRHFGYAPRRLRRTCFLNDTGRGGLRLLPSQARFFNLYLPASLFPLFWAANGGFFWGPRRNGGGPMRHVIDAGRGNRNHSLSAYFRIFPLCPQLFLSDLLPLSFPSLGRGDNGISLVCLRARMSIWLSIDPRGGDRDRSLTLWYIVDPGSDAAFSLSLFLSEFRNFGLCIIRSGPAHRWTL